MYDRLDNPHENEATELWAGFFAIVAASFIFLILLRHLANFIFWLF